jgi:UDPglucose--hexose-1-phosphate uridylyltransferase
LGHKETQDEEELIKYDKNCYLCPGNKRINGELNENYESTFVFENDFPALLKEQFEIKKNNKNDLENYLFVSESVKGICKVICFDPDHSKSLALMNKIEIKKILDSWCEEYIKISKIEYINYIQIFENKGSMMGTFFKKIYF